jgi:hypothetical protein
MNGNRFIYLFLLFFALSCHNREKQEVQPENDLDAARNFIRAALDGKFDDAKTYLLQDTTNLTYLNIARNSFDRQDQATRNNYRSSSINIHEVEPLIKDSLTLVIFSNSFRNDHDSLKVVRMNGRWLVDLKYLYAHDMDTLVNKLIKKDSLNR